MVVFATYLPTVASAQETTDSASMTAPNQAPLAFCAVEPVTFTSSQLMPEGHIKVQADRTEIIENTVALFSGHVGADKCFSGTD